MTVKDLGLETTFDVAKGDEDCLIQFQYRTGNYPALIQYLPDISIRYPFNYYSFENDIVGVWQPKGTKENRNKPIQKSTL